jgi:hypothetical protein
MTCSRCGADSDYERMAKRRERGLPLLCPSCCAKPSKVIRTKYGRCRPHQGKFDDHDNPLDEAGNLYRPGPRLCGMRDCVEQAHITGWDSPWWARAEMERLQMEPKPRKRRVRRKHNGQL